MKPADDVNSSTDTPGLPGLRSWGQVYISVTIIFVIWVGLLALLTRLYQ